MNPITINPAALSKINWTNGVAFAAALLAVFGVKLDPATKHNILAAIALGVPFVTMVLRTFFTAKPAK